jgi:hypothetical protein
MPSRTARKTEKRPSAFDVNPSRVVLNVLGYSENEEWVALALEMDLRGYGPTFREALEELTDVVATQIRFAHFKGQAELIWKSAEPVWFERFADIRRERLNALVQDRQPLDPSFDVASLVIPPTVAARKPEFIRAEI